MFCTLYGAQQQKQCDKAAPKQKQVAAGNRSATKTTIERKRTECFGY
jgi:hypothetical protein